MSKASTFNLSSYPVVNSHSSEILGFFTITDPVKGIVTIEKSGGVFLWALPALRSYRLFQLSEAPESVAFSPERRLFAVAKGDLVTLRRFEDGEEVSALHRLKTRASSMVFQPNGRTLLIGGTDGELYRWRFEDEKLTNLPKEQERMLERYFGHAKVISAVAYHPIGRVFFSGDWGGALSAWLPYDADAFKGKYDENNFGSRTYTDRSTRVHGDRAAATSIEHLALSPDGEQLLVGSQDGALEWWRVRGFSMLATISAHKGLIYDLAIAPSGKRAASVGRDGMLRVWALTETAVPETAKSEFTLDKLKEMPLAGAARILFLNENTAIVGDKSGSVSVVTL